MNTPHLKSTPVPQVAVSRLQPKQGVEGPQGGLGFWVPLEASFPGLVKRGERCSHSTKTVNEPRIEIGEHQEALQILHCLGLGPNLHSSLHPFPCSQVGCDTQGTWSRCGIHIFLL